MASGDPVVVAPGDGVALGDGVAPDCAVSRINVPGALLVTIAGGTVGLRLGRGVWPSGAAGGTVGVAAGSAFGAAVVAGN